MVLAIGKYADKNAKFITCMMSKKRNMWKIHPFWVLIKSFGVSFFGFPPKIPTWSCLGGGMVASKKVGKGVLFFGVVLFRLQSCRLKGLPPDAVLLRAGAKINPSDRREAPDYFHSPNLPKVPNLDVYDRVISIEKNPFKPLFPPHSTKPEENSSGGSGGRTQGSRGGGGH